MEIEHVYEALPHRARVLDWAKTDEPLARFLSRLGSPPVIALIGITVMATVIGNSNGWGWALAYLILAVPLPTLYVLWKVRRGEITDFDIRVREQRIKRHGFRIAFAPDLIVYARDHRRLQRGTLRKTLHSVTRCALLYFNLMPDRWRSHDWGYWSGQDTIEKSGGIQRY